MRFDGQKEGTHLARDHSTVETGAHVSLFISQ